VDNEYLSEIEHDTLGFLNQTPRQMIEHLLTRGGALDFADTKDLLASKELVFDPAIREWEAKPAADKTWVNIKTFISAEYAKENKQNKLSAKHFKANAMMEQAEATEELIANLTEAHTRQMEALVKTTTEAMKEMMLLMKENKTPTPKATDEEKKKKHDDKKKKYNDAPVCKHCGKKHPSKAEDECWELEKNKDSRPATWKSTKST